MKQLLKYLQCILMLLGIIVSITAKADVWEDAKVKIYFSENKEFKLVITPKITPEKYYLWIYYKSNKHPQTKKILRQKEKFMHNISGKDTIIIPCIAELYSIDIKDSALIWKRPLLNEISPVHAIISNDGSSVATFDNWYSIGYGVNVFVIYNENGDAKKTYKLEEISPFPLNDYRMTISSLNWNTEDKFIDNARVEISFGTDDGKLQKRIYNTKKLEFEN